MWHFPLAALLFLFFASCLAPPGTPPSDSSTSGIPSDPNRNQQKDDVANDAGRPGGDATGVQGRYEGIVENTAFHVVTQSTASRLDFSVRKAGVGDSSSGSPTFNWDKMLVTFFDQNGKFQIAYFEKNKLADPLDPPKKGDPIFVASVVTSLAVVGYEVAFYEGEVYVFLDWPPDIFAAAYSVESDPSGARLASLMGRSFENGGPKYWIRAPWRTDAEERTVQTVEILIKKYSVNVAFVRYRSSVIEGYRTCTGEIGSGTLRPREVNTDPENYIFTSGDPNGTGVPPYHIKVFRDMRLAPFEGKIPRLYGASAQLGLRSFSIHGGCYDHFSKTTIPPILMVTIPIVAGICSYPDAAAWSAQQCALSFEQGIYNPAIPYAAHVYAETELPAPQSSPQPSGMPGF